MCIIRFNWFTRIVIILLCIILISCEQISEDSELYRHNKTFKDNYYITKKNWWVNPDYKRDPEDQLYSNKVPLKSKPAWK